MSDEWEKEKEKILGSLLGGGQELASLPSSIEVHGKACLVQQLALKLYNYVQLYKHMCEHVFFLASFKIIMRALSKCLSLSCCR